VARLLFPEGTQNICVLTAKFMTALPNKILSGAPGRQSTEMDTQICAWGADYMRWR